MSNTITIGLDIAKNVFQVHGVDKTGAVVLQRRLRRRAVEPFFAKLPPALIGIEACGSAHHWGRVLQQLGHEVRLMPPAYVKPYVKRNKTDGRDAEAICEAVTRPTMRFVAIKSVEAQAVASLHRSHDLLVRQRTMLGNALRGILAEFGLIAAQGIKGLTELMQAVEQAPIPEAAREALEALARQWKALDCEVRALERRIVRAAKESEAARRLMEIPGVGPIVASAIVTAVADPHVFRSGRGFAAWLGLHPRQNNSGDKRRSGPISKQGNRNVRRVLIIGATSHMRHARTRPSKDPWLTGLLARRPAKVAAVARAAKNARIAWALLTRGQHYRAPAAAA